MVVVEQKDDDVLLASVREPFPNAILFQANTSQIVYLGTLKKVQEK